ncbi:MAG TPA: circadian clock KaiB family protein [Methanoregula sp.]|nr:circadian clock KaiB family protein [Methanoregula sp.]
MDDPGANNSEKTPPGDCVDLRLYVVDHTSRCRRAFENLVRICNACAGMRYRIVVIDIEKNPVIAREDEITAIPTLIRIPRREGTRKIIGTLSDQQKVIEELGLAGQGNGVIPAPAAH